MNGSGLRVAVSYGLTLGAMLGAGPAQAQVGQFNIPSEVASKSIPELARQAGVQILAPGEPLQSVITPEIIGTFDVVAALELMLKGTDLRVSRTPEGIIAISSKDITCDDGGETMSHNPRNSASLLALMFAALTAPICHAQGGSDADAVETVVVTGSRIAQHSGFEAPTPVTVLSADQLNLAAPTSLPDALNQMPQFLGSESPQANPHTNANQPWNGNILNLRDVSTLTSPRTLILEDSMRVPPTTYLGAVNTDIVPQMLVQRVDIVTAGASAAYGSDAVAGVVNFIIDKNFTGIKGLLQVGATQRGDNFNERAGVAWGGDLLPHLHLIASVEEKKGDGLTKGDRPKYNASTVACGSVVGSPFAAGTVQNPLINCTDVQQTFSAPGLLVLSGPFANYQFFSPTVYGPVNAGFPTGTQGIVEHSNYMTVNDPRAAIISPTDTQQGYARLNYEITDDISASASFSFGRTHSHYGTFADFQVPWLVYSGNAFLPASLQAELTSTNTPFFVYSKQFPETPFPATIEDTFAYGAMAGLNGKLWGKFTWQLAYVYGSSLMKTQKTGEFDQQKYAAATDAVDEGTFLHSVPNGNIVCRVNLTNPGLYPGCVPFNLFGIGAASDAAVAYIEGVSRFRAINTTNDLSANIQGDIVDLWAGPLSVAAGFEYRNEKLNLSSNSDPAVPLDLTGLRGFLSPIQRFFFTNVGVADGSEDVKEGYVELELPLLKDVKLAQSLAVNGAWRYTEYSISGDVQSWKIGATWQPIDDIKFRVTRSRDIRAPTLYDLFAGAQFNIQGSYDPHTRIQSTLTTIASGNTALVPEIGNTFTGGVVVQPRFIPNFHLSVDYFNLRIKNAITQMYADTILQYCELSNGTSPLCDLVVRPHPFSDHSADNYPTYVHVTGANVATLKTSGIDIEGSYQTEVEGGQLGLRLYATYVDSYLTQNTVYDAPIQLAGYGEQSHANPRVRATLSANYTIGDFMVYAQERFYSGMKLGPLNHYDLSNLPDVYYTDLTLQYNLNAYDGVIGLFLTVNNLFDKDPPYITTPPGAAGLEPATNLYFYDLAGRTFTVGARINF